MLRPSFIARASRSITTRFIPRDISDGGPGVAILRSIGLPDLITHDPFLLLDDFSVNHSGGFPDHPHRGFETVTYMLEGQFQHEDFAGHKGTIGPGDLQWMTAGRGIMHAEMPADRSDTSSVVSKGLQLWINLPKKDKMCEPEYQELKDKTIPRVSPTPGTTIKVIAGESHGVKSKVYTRTPTMYLDFKMSNHQKVSQTIPPTFRGFVYPIKGKVFVGSEGFEGDPHQVLLLSDPSTIQDKERIGFGHPDELLLETKDEEAHFVLVAGQPLNEPVFSKMPMSMNSEQEVKDAFLDFKKRRNGFERGASWKSAIAGK